MVAWADSDVPEMLACYAGSFKTKTEALERRWVDGELAALRVPDLSALERDPVRTPTLAEAALRWQASRVDLAENTKVRRRLEVKRILPPLGDRRVDEARAGDVVEFVAVLVSDGYAAARSARRCRCS
jgi:hypothetical protein